MQAGKEPSHCCDGFEVEPYVGLEGCDNGFMGFVASFM